MDTAEKITYHDLVGKYGVANIVKDDLPSNARTIEVDEPEPPTADFPIVPVPVEPAPTAQADDDEDSPDDEPDEDEDYEEDEEDSEEDFNNV